jgi:D-lactate dehydrogenase
MNIAFYSTRPYEQAHFNKANTHHSITYFAVALTEKTAALAKGHDVACAFVNDQVNAATLEALWDNGIRLLALRCAGYNNVDLKAAAATGIRIVRVPAYSPHAVAEHAMALILTLNRKIHKAYNRVREGNFSLEKLTGFDLFEKKVGVIGTGKIGAAFARIAKGFGCKVLAHDVHHNKELKAEGITYTALETLLKESDVVSLHCPLTTETNHMISTSTLTLMKKGAMLINTSRGALIDTGAVIESLKSGHLGYLGLDVYEQEEHVFFEDLSDIVIKDDVLMRLMTFPNVVITAHQGFFTEEALTEIANTTLNNIDAFEEGVELKNEVRIWPPPKPLPRQGEPESVIA